MLAVSAPAWADDRPIVEAVAPYFTVYSVLSEKETRQYVSSLDALYRLLAAATGNAQATSAGALHIYLLSRADWEHFWGRESWEQGATVGAGLFAADVLIPVASPYGDPYGYSLAALGRRIALTHCAAGCMPWFDQALVEFARTAAVFPDRIEIRVPAWYVQWLQTSNWMPAERFYGTRYDDLSYLERRMPSGFYAQAWLLMHYAYMGNPEFLRKIAIYGARIHEGVKPSAALPAMLGNGEFDLGTKEYGKQPAFKTGTIHTQALSDAELQVRTLSRVAAARELTALGLRTSVSSKRNSMFNRVSRGLPDDPWLLAYSAQMVSEALTKSYAAKRDEIAALERRIESLAQPYDAEVPAALAEAHVTIGAKHAWDTDGTAAQIADAAQVRAARQEFERALQLDANHLESLAGYALTCRLLKECLDDAAARLQHGLAVAPLSWGIVKAEAELLRALGKNNEADGYWALLARMSPDADGRRYALKQTRAYAERILVVP